jgi:Domain of unknown function (DUF4397)
MKNISLYICCLVLGLLGVSCGDEHNFTDSVTLVTGGARLKIHHAAVDVPGIVISVNDKVVSGVITISPAAPGLLNYGSTFPASDYIVVPAGAVKITITQPATATVAERVLTASVNVQDGKYYTVHALGNAGTYSFLTSEDDLSVPDANKTYLRFINAVTGTTSPGIEFLLDGKVVATAAGLSDGKETFLAYEQPGSARFTITMRETGKTATIGNSLASLNLVRGKKYTIIARGLFGNTVTATRPTISQIFNN